MKQFVTLTLMLALILSLASCRAPQEEELVSTYRKNVPETQSAEQSGQQTTETENAQTTEQAAPSDDSATGKTPSGDTKTPAGTAEQQTPSDTSVPDKKDPAASDEQTPKTTQKETAQPLGDELEYDLGSEVRWFGRTYVENDTYWFNMTASGFEFSFNGTGAEAIFVSKNNYASKESAADHVAYIKVYVDGGKGTSVMITDDMPTVTLASKLKKGDHTIRVVKRTNARSSSCGLYSLTLTKGGKKLTPPAAKMRKIEFIGDSLTVGYGAIANASTAKWSTLTEDGTVTFAALTAEAFDAEMQVVAVSGRGIVRNNGGDSNKTIPQMFRYADIYNSSLKWDYSKYQPDVVVINAGGNDATVGVSEAEMKETMGAFLAEVRKAYPKAQIFLLFNPHTPDYSGVYKTLAASMNNVTYVQIEKLTAEQKALGHPNITGHKVWAKTLQTAISKATGWK